MVNIKKLYRRFIANTASHVSLQDYKNHFLFSDTEWQKGFSEQMFMEAPDDDNFIDGDNCSMNSGGEDYDWSGGECPNGYC